MRRMEKEAATRSRMPGRLVEGKRVCSSEVWLAKMPEYNPIIGRPYHGKNEWWIFAFNRSLAPGARGRRASQQFRTRKAAEAKMSKLNTCADLTRFIKARESD